MGFLIFAYRKLFLKRKINDLNYQSMVLSQKKQQITDQIGTIQQAISAAKSAVSLFSNMAMQQTQKDVMSKYIDPKTGQLTDQSKQTEMATELQTKQWGVMAANNLCNSIFEGADQAQLAYLNAMDSQISLQIANIDSQTKQLAPELENVEKAEDQAAKSEAPKFGLG